MIDNNLIDGKLITPDMKFSGVYLIINLLNNKYYVGSAKDLRYRMRNHFCDLKNNSHKNIHLQRSYNKNPNSFIMVMIEKVDNFEDLTIREQFWMDELNVSDKSICYNILNVANSLLGFKHSEATKKKISEVQIGKKLSEDHKKKIGKSSMGNKGRTGMPAHNKKTVVQLDKQGNFIKEWGSITDAANTLNLQLSHIHNCCTGKRKTHGGFKWEFKVNTNYTYN